MARAAKKHVKAKNKKRAVPIIPVVEPPVELDSTDRLLVSRKLTDDVYKATLINKYKELSS